MPTPQKKEIISATKNLYIFNPEHDFALATGRGSYTLPREVANLKSKFTLLPATYAGNGDFILIHNENSGPEISTLPYFKEFKEKGIEAVTLGKLCDLKGQIGSVIPWGWNHYIRKLLLSNGIEEGLLPSEDIIDRLRFLSHRRTSISFLSEIKEDIPHLTYRFPREVDTLEGIENFLTENPVSYLKAPWSSSGRGIVVSDHITRKGLLEWSWGIIRRQGSVICEPAWDRVFDFATEWWCEKGTPVFVGLSVFSASSRGKYHGNIEATQTELKKIIKENVPSFSDDIISAQYKAISKLISPYYDGPLGIDMLADREGNINPCVEINLRLTMGFINTEKGKQLLHQTDRK